MPQVGRGHPDLVRPSAVSPSRSGSAGGEWKNMSVREVGIGGGGSAPPRRPERSARPPPPPPSKSSGSVPQIQAQGQGQRQQPQVQITAQEQGQQQRMGQGARPVQVPGVGPRYPALVGSSPTNLAGVGAGGGRKLRRPESLRPKSQLVLSSGNGNASAQGLVGVDEDEGLGGEGKKKGWKFWKRMTMAGSAKGGS